MWLTTVNLWSGRADPGALRDFLDDVAPDVVAAQEVGVDVAPVLASSHPYGFVRGMRDVSGKALVATGPIDVEELALPERSGLMARIGDVQVLAIHLTNPIGGREAFDLRRRQVDIVLEEAARHARVVVVGDMNATPVWPAYRRLRRGLTDGVAEWASANGRRPRRTWSKVPYGPAVLRIDHVLTKGVVIDDCRVDRVVGSDHRAVTVEVSPS